MGNLLSLADGSSAMAFSYDGLNRLSSVDDTGTLGAAHTVVGYAYDDEGNLTLRTEIASGSVRQFDYDHRNRLTRVTDRVSAGGVITQEVNYTYDALNRRIVKTMDADGAGAGGDVTTHFIYDREDVILDFVDADGAGPGVPVRAMRYLHGPGADMVLAQEDGSGVVLWLLTDHLGTTRDLVDNAGVLANHIKYDSFGNVISQTNPAAATRYLYTGRELEAETGLYYYRARFYDPTLGRFTQRDPIGFGDGMNQYEYVKSDPINYVDVDGLVRRRRGASSRNRSRITNLSLLDERGKELLNHWLEGSEEMLVLKDQSWKSYMMANTELPWQLRSRLRSDARSRTNSGPINFRFQALIENGYTTGYELLHGTDAAVGDFHITGRAVVAGKGTDRLDITYELQYRWNDIIDPNPDYRLDTILASVLEWFYDPGDYVVRVIWDANSSVTVCDGQIQEERGYPFDI